MSADYYVVVHAEDSTMLGLSTLRPLPDMIPDGFELVGMSGPLPKSLDYWNKATRSWDAEIPAATFFITKTAFMLRFSAEERIAIRASTDPYVKDFMMLADGAPEIDLLFPGTVQGVGYLAMTNLIQPERVAQILMVS